MEERLRAMSPELKTKDIGSLRGRWKIKLLLIVVFFLICGVVSAGVFLYQKIGTERAQKDYLLAQTLLDSGRAKDAREAMLPIYQKYPTFPQREKVIYSLAKSFQDAEAREAEPYWESLLAEFPESQHSAEALTALALIAQASGDHQLSQQRWARLTKEYPNSEGAAYSELSRADELAQTGKVEEARTLYYQIIQNSPPGSKFAGEAMDKLSVINTSYLFSAVPNEWNQLVQIQKGDSLMKLAYKYKTTANFIAKANGRDLNWSLVPNQRITVPTIESYRIVVDKDDLHLYLYTGSGKFIKRYLVGIGRMDHLTPPGQYVIWHKLKSPVWHDRDTGRIVKPDSPDYPLGTRWMTISPASNPEAFSRLGIHGTNEPETIGQRASDGCVRMSNEESEELFIIVPKGTPVEIVQKRPAPQDSGSQPQQSQPSPLQDWLEPRIQGEATE